MPPDDSDDDVATDTIFTKMDQLPGHMSRAGKLSQDENQVGRIMTNPDVTVAINDTLLYCRHSILYVRFTERALRESEYMVGSSWTKACFKRRLLPPRCHPDRPPYHTSYCHCYCHYAPVSHQEQQ